jgi:hypothetical protein
LARAQSYASCFILIRPTWQVRRPQGDVQRAKYPEYSPTLRKLPTTPTAAAKSAAGAACSPSAQTAAVERELRDWMAAHGYRPESVT